MDPHSYPYPYSYPYSYTSYGGCYDHGSCCHKKKYWLKFKGPVNAKGYQLCGLPDPEKPSCAATKKYVDEKIAEKSGKIDIFQGKLIPQKTSHISFQALHQIPPSVVLSLTNLGNLHNRLISVYAENVTTEGFDVVTNMEANLNRFLSNNNPSVAPSPPTLAILAGNPAVSLPDAINNQNVVVNSLVRANDSIGATTMTNITPSKMGQTLGVVDGLPCTVQVMNNTTVVYNRGTTADGKGAWNSMNITVPSSGVQLYSITNPVQLNAGVYFLAYNDQNLLSIINSKADGSDVWSVNVAGPTPFTSLFPAYQVASAAIGCYPALIVKTIGPTITYRKSTTKDGSGPWNQVVVDIENVVVGPVFDLIEINGGASIFYAYGPFNLPTGTAHQIQIDNDNNLISNKLIFTVESTIVSSISSAIINGHPAVALSTYGDTTTSKFYYSRSTDVAGDNWPAPQVIFEGIASGDEGFTNAVSLASVSGNPAVVINNYMTAFTSEYRYLRAGDENEFVEDANYAVNWIT